MPTSYSLKKGCAAGARNDTALFNLGSGTFVTSNVAFQNITRGSGNGGVIQLNGISSTVTLTSATYNKSHISAFLRTLAQESSLYALYTFATMHFTLYTLSTYAV